MNRIPHTQGFLISALSAVALTFGASLYPQAGVADWAGRGTGRPRSTEHRDRRFRESAQQPGTHLSRGDAGQDVRQDAVSPTERDHIRDPGRRGAGCRTDHRQAALQVRARGRQRDLAAGESGAVFIRSDEELGQVVSNHDHLVLCPICYRERFGDRAPDYGVLPSPEDLPYTVSPFAVIDVLANADKVIDF